MTSAKSPGSIFLGIARVFSEPAQLPAPMVGKARLKRAERKPVPCGVRLRDAVPAAMLDRDARFIADRFKTHLDLGRVVRRNACGPP